MVAARASATVACNLCGEGTVSMNASLSSDPVELLQEQRTWS
jgi:formylmethanofuran dehydrogenase subunit E